MNISKRDLFWLILSLAVSGASSAALVSAVVEPSHRTILDLDWSAILGCAGAAMFGGVMGTLFVLHKAGEDGRQINIPLQLALDLGRAIILAFIVYGAFAIQKWEPDLLPAVLALAGMLGDRILNPIGRALIKMVTISSDRSSGPPKS